MVGSSMAMEQVGRMPAVAQGRASSEAREPGLAMATSGPEPESAVSWVGVVADKTNHIFSPICLI